MPSRPAGHSSPPSAPNRTMPTLNYLALSQPARACAWFIRYADLEVDFRTIDLLKGEHKAPEYVAKFPAGQVPTFEDGDFYLEESSVILKYLAAGHDIVPKCPKKAAKVNLLIARHDATGRKIATDIAGPILFKTGDEQTKALTEGRPVVEGILKKFDDALDGSKYLLGDELTLADFLFGTEIDQLEWLVDNPIVGDLLAEFPNVKAYYGRIKEVKGFAESFAEAKVVFDVFTAPKAAAN